MEKKKLTDLTFEELKLRQKNAKKVFIGLACVVILVNAVLVFLIFKSELYALFAVVVASMITLLPNYIILAQTNQEIKSRQTQQNS